MYNNEPRSSVTKVKHLGLHFYSCLSELTVISIAKKKRITRILFLIGRLSVCLLRRAKRVGQLLKSAPWITPVHHCSLLKQNLKPTNKLQMIQNQTVKVLLNMDARNHINRWGYTVEIKYFKCDRAKQLKLNNVFRLVECTPTVASDTVGARGWIQHGARGSEHNLVQHSWYS